MGCANSEADLETMDCTNSETAVETIGCTAKLVQRQWVNQTVSTDVQISRCTVRLVYGHWAVLQSDCFVENRMYKWLG